LGVSVTVVATLVSGETILGEAVFAPDCELQQEERKAVAVTVVVIQGLVVGKFCYHVRVGIVGLRPEVARDGDHVCFDVAVVVQVGYECGGHVYMVPYGQHHLYLVPGSARLEVVVEHVCLDLVVLWEEIVPAVLDLHCVLGGGNEVHDETVVLVQPFVR